MRAKTLIWVSLLFGVAFIGISLPGVLAVPDEIAKGNYAVLLVLLFPLVGIGALVLFVYSLIAWRKFGRTEIILDPAPGSIAGYVVGKQSGDIVFPIAFGGMGGVCTLIGLYVLGNTLTTTVSSQGIRIVHTIFGVRFQRNAAREEISKLERRIGSQMQTGYSMRVYYAIDAHTRDGRRITVADSLEGSRLADFVEAKIRDALWPEKKQSNDSLELVMD
jgi:hypothetical protein